MTKLFFLLSIITAFSISAGEAPLPPCSADEYRQFDFWLGHWTSYTKDGKKQGTNRLEKLMGGCVIQENWVGSTGQFKGTSFNFYDPVKKQWHQTWIDNSGATLLMDGGLVDGSMQLSGERKSRKGESVIDRITWTPLDDGRVRQHWQASSDKGATWAEVFDGYYRLEEPPTP
ncbi:MAG: hypothetical protein O6945_08875 [Gammaproteobacteria bacterium]|nr:hypothetical protein [Gammaproteobacteria bacterium]